MTEHKLSIWTEDSELGKPKLLSTQAIYNGVKGAVLALPFSSPLFEKTVEALNALTKLINERTSANIVVIDQKNAEEFTTQLDGYVSDQLLVLDDGLGHMRQQLHNALQALYEAIRAQLQLLRAGKLPEVAARGVGTSCGILVGMFQVVSERVKANYPETYDKLNTIATNVWSGLENRAEALVNSAKDSMNSVAGQSRHAASGVDTRITEASTYLLQSAQPYVHTAVRRGTPLFNSALEATQPYVEQAKPYLDPLVSRAQGVQRALEDHQLVGPYVVRAYENANRTLQDAKVYCLAEDIAEAEGPIKTAASGLGVVGTMPLYVVPAVAERAALTLDRVVKGRAAEEVVTPVAAAAEGAALVGEVVAGAAAGVAAGVAEGRIGQKTAKGAAVVSEAVAGAADGVAQSRVGKQMVVPLAAAAKGVAVVRDVVTGAAAGAAQGVGLTE